MDERWADIEGYEGHYQISNHGRVRALNRYIKCSDFHIPMPAKILVLAIDTDGYRIVHLCLNGIGKNKRVGRLVAIHFIKNTHNLPIVDHKDGNKQNDHVENLEWVSNAENIKRAYILGLAIPKKGSSCGASKLTEDQVIDIRERASNGEIHNNIRKDYGISAKQIHNIIHRKNWNHI